MNTVESALRRIVADLTARGQRFALVGGFAVSARTEPRFTRDVDLVVAVPDDARAERLLRSLMAEGYVVLTTIEHDAAKRMASARLASTVSRDDEFVVDLLFASSGVEPEIVQAAEMLELLDGVNVPVAALGHLLAMKLLARDDDTRPQDAGDLTALRAAADSADLALASETATLIVSRGYAQGRDLGSAARSLAAGN